ncbi:MAG TPA: hypothetical protein VFV97_17120 [Rhodanobacteraceae bacterium]|nr:hypothetical protein [Rhodanobacteraceae bacterium]
MRAILAGTLLAFASVLSVVGTSVAASRIAMPGDGIGAYDDAMGQAVALSGDTVAVGIPHGQMTPLSAPGAIAIFRDVSGTWQREAFLGPGLPPAFALQQDILVVGGTHVETFVRDGTTWSQHDVLATTAGSVALSGDTLLVADTGSAAGTASAYLRDNGTWVLQGALAGDQPGESLGIVSLDGDVAAAVGYVNPGHITESYVHFYHRSGTTWTLESTISSGGGLGPPTVPVAVSGQTVLVGTGTEVDAYVRDPAGTWSLQGMLDPLVAYAPGSVAIDGDRAVVGSPNDGIPGVFNAGTAYVFERSGGTWSRTDHVADPDATESEMFATSVALQGDALIAGAPGAVTAAGQAGRANVVDVGTLPASNVATLDAGNAHAHEKFGANLGVSGSTLVVAAPQADTIEYVPRGAAYVFGLASDGWTLEAELQGPDIPLYNGFATSVAASTDTVVVGSPADNQTGAAYIYTRGDGSWPEAARLAPDDASTNRFGEAIAFDGDRIAIGAPFQQGSVYLYTGSGSTWVEETRLLPPPGSDGDWFGNSLALDGDTILVGAFVHNVGIEAGAGAAFVFVNDGAGWEQQAMLQSPTPLANTGFGASVAMRGDTALVGTNYSQGPQQHAYVFQRTGATWALEATLDFDSTASMSYVASLAISSDESTIAIGVPTQAPGAGLVHTFVRGDGDVWVPSRTFGDDGPGNPGGFDGYGAALAFDGESLFVGATQDGAGGAVYDYSFGDSILASGFDAP